MKVSSQSDLQNISDADKVKLVGDITLTGKFNTISTFSGVFDGNGYTIRDLKTQFITEIADNAVIKNIKFKNVKTEESIFQSNSGTIDSITIQNLTTPLTEERISGLVHTNTETISNCKMLDSEIKSKGSSAGLVYESKDNSEIIDCTIKNSSIISKKYFASGLCKTASTSTVQNCNLRNINVLSSKGSIGVVKEPGDSTFEDISVMNSTVHSRADSTGITIGTRNFLFNCSIVNSKIIGSRTNLMSGQVSKNCYSEQCTIKVLSEQAEIELFGFSNSTIQNCFVKSLSIYGEQISFRDKNNNTFENSYVQATLISAKGTFENISNKNHLYYDLTIQRPTSKTVHIDNKQDFKKVERTDTVELQTDIHLTDKETLETPALFTGEFIGNQHTISNLKQPLFSFLQGKVTDLFIENLNPQGRNSISAICDRASSSTVRNIHLTQQKPLNTNIQINFHSLTKSCHKTLIENCTAIVNLKEPNGKIDKISGITKALNSGKIQNCNVILNTHNNVHGDINGIAEKISSGKIYKCYTTGKIIENKFSVRINGITGHIDGNRKGTPIVKNNISNIHIKENYTTYNSQHNFSGTSGIVGFNDNGTIKNCKFTGKIEGNIDQNNKTLHCSGICRDNTGKISNCVNTGSINYNTEAHTRNSAIAGICSRIRRTAQIINCENYGHINGIEKVGGIVAKASENIKIKNVINNGTVSSNDTAGGLIGQIYPNTTIQIQDGYNNSTLKANNKCDPLIGINQTSNLKFKQLLWKQNNQQHSTFGDKTTADIEKIQLLFKL